MSQAIAILLLYVGAFVPFRVSLLEDLSDSMSNFEIFVDISFGADIILSFFTAYEWSDGQTEMRHKYIAKDYLKACFFLDIIATVPFDRIQKRLGNTSSVNGVNMTGKLTRLPRLMKILRLAPLLKVLRLYRFKK